MSGCVLLLCPLDVSIWITSDRIRPPWSSHPVSEEATHRQEHMHMHIITHLCMHKQGRRPVQPVAAACADAPRGDVFHAEPFQRKFRWLRRDLPPPHSPLSSFLLLLWLRLVYGL